jgi:hypothetical protein
VIRNDTVARLKTTGEVVKVIGGGDNGYTNCIFTLRDPWGNPILSRKGRTSVVQAVRNDKLNIEKD